MDVEQSRLLAGFANLLSTLSNATRTKIKDKLGLEWTSAESSFPSLQAPSTEVLSPSTDIGYILDSNLGSTFSNSLQNWTDNPEEFFHQTNFSLGQNLCSYIQGLEKVEMINAVRLRFTKREFYRYRETWGPNGRDDFLEKIRRGGCSITKRKCERWSREGKIYCMFTENFGDEVLFPLKLTSQGIKDINYKEVNTIIAGLRKEGANKAMRAIVDRYTTAAGEITAHLRKQLAISNILGPYDFPKVVDGFCHERPEQAHKKRKTHHPATRSPNAVGPEPAGVTLPPTAPGNTEFESQHSSSVSHPQDRELQQNQPSTTLSPPRAAPAEGPAVTRSHLAETPRSRSTSTGLPAAASDTRREAVAPIPRVVGSWGLQANVWIHSSPALGTGPRKPESQDRVASSGDWGRVHSLPPQSRPSPMEPRNPANTARYASIREAQEDIPQSPSSQSFSSPYSTSTQQQLQLHQPPQLRVSRDGETVAHKGHQVQLNFGKDSPNRHRTSVLVYANPPPETRLVYANSQTADLSYIDSQAYTRQLGAIESSRDRASTATPDYRADMEVSPEQPGSSGQSNDTPRTQLGLPRFLQSDYGEHENLSPHIQGEEYCPDLPYSAFAISNEHDWNMRQTLSFCEADNFDFNFWNATDDAAQPES
ncbi:hypothetical protein FALBO_3022 [Fusarium albosuccineum]|uniref:Uncharacterized protein n=1 Tax=Fusarium albosuccineum TaxID=1237068 RepID=A0A8H4LIK9_9HYPO|nr:hypothetical protein FALBO_3022 [Fusarium albosuccineum]